MDTEDEIERIADAAAPDPECRMADIQRGDPEPEPEPIDVAAERARATAAAVLHLERERRRAARHPHPGAWSDLGLFEARYCVIDTETTGAHAGGADDILEVGAVRVVDGELDRTFSSLVRPVRPISAAAHAVHGIRPEDVLDAPPIATVLPYVLEMARDCVLVFHNAGFDLGFLQRALAESERPLLTSPVVDTLVVARQLAGGRCGLGTVAARMGAAGPHVHRALPDAELTARLLVAFLDILTAAGARCLGEIPGIRARPPRSRIRRRPRVDALAHRLEEAVACGETLRISYRLGHGMQPQELHVRPHLLQSGACVALDLDRGRDCILEFDRIERLAPAT
jgi:DNA polymerase III epsilon subunit family exonuclease